MEEKKKINISPNREMVMREPRSGDKVLVDLKWNGVGEPNPTSQGRIIGVTQTEYYVRVTGYGEKYVKKNCVKLEIPYEYGFFHSIEEENPQNEE